MTVVSAYDRVVVFKRKQGNLQKRNTLRIRSSERILYGVFCVFRTQADAGRNESVTDRLCRSWGVPVRKGRRVFIRGIEIVRCILSERLTNSGNICYNTVRRSAQVRDKAQTAKGEG